MIRNFFCYNKVLKFSVYWPRISGWASSSTTSSPGPSIWHLHTNSGSTAPSRHKQPLVKNHIRKTTSKWPSKIRVRNIYHNYVVMAQRHCCSVIVESWFVEHVDFLNHLRSVQSAHRVFCISGIFELHECESGRIPGHPYVSQGPIFAKRALDFVFTCGRTQISYVHFARQVPLTITRHYLCFLILERINYL